MTYYILYNEIDDPVAYIAATESYEQPYTSFVGQARYIDGWDVENGNIVLTKCRFHSIFHINCDFTANWWFYGEDGSPNATSHYTTLEEDGLIDHMRIMAFVWRVAKNFFMEHHTAICHYSLEKEDEIMGLLLKGYSIKQKTYTIKKGE